MLARRTIVTAFAAVIIQACGQPDPQQSRATYGPGDGSQDSVLQQSASNSRQETSPEKEHVAASLRCSPSSFSKGDTLTLTMVTPHADGLSVDHPDGTVFYIIYPSYGEPTLKYSMMPSEDFKRVATLRIPADIKANPRVYGREHGVEGVFDRPGSYLLKVAELGTDHGPPVWQCVVRFR